MTFEESTDETSAQSVSVARTVEAVRARRMVHVFTLIEI